MVNPIIYDHTVGARLAIRAEGFISGISSISLSVKTPSYDRIAWTPSSYVVDDGLTIYYYTQEGDIDIPGVYHIQPIVTLENGNIWPLGVICWTVYAQNEDVPSGLTPGSLDWNALLNQLNDAQSTTISPIAPSDALEGDYWYDTDESKLYIYVNDEWTAVATQGPPGPVTNSTFSETFPMVEVTGLVQLAEPNHSYLVNNTQRVSITLPATASCGDIIEVMGKGLGGWLIEQRDNQYVRVGDESTTVGSTGKVESTGRYDVITIKCTTNDVEWTANSVVGNVSVI